MRLEQRRVTGFTLIEIVMVLAVIGVLCALCIPAYGDYTRRTYVSEGLVLAAVGKVRVVEEVMVNNNSARIGPRARPTAEILAEDPSRMIKRIIRADSMVIITYNRQLDPGGQIEYSLVLEGSFLAANGKMVWECLSGDAASSRLGAARSMGASVGDPLPPEWAPAGCRS